VQGFGDLERSQVEASRWVETSTEYDAFGRPVSVRDPKRGNNDDEYVVSPDNSVQTQTTVTNALGHEAVTDWHPEFGIPPRETERPPGRRTS
jgi:hypothetical protein